MSTYKMNISKYFETWIKPCLIALTLQYIVFDFKKMGLYQYSIVDCGIMVVYIGVSLKKLILPTPCPVLLKCKDPILFLPA